MLYPTSHPKPNSADDLIGYVDHFGREIVPPSYAVGGYFAEGLAGVVREDGLSGFIDESGREQIGFKFQGVGIFHEGVCSIGSGSAVGLIDHAGAWVVRPRFLVLGELSEGLALASKDGVSFGFLDESGNFVIEPKFETLRSFRDGLAPACRDGNGATSTEKGR
jgi:WG containing repeat